MNTKNEIDNDMMHLAKITLAQLGNNLQFTEDEIFQAMEKAIAKEQNMSEQLEKSYFGNRVLFDGFTKQISGIFYDKVNER